MKGSGDSPIYFPKLSAKLASEVSHQRIKLCTKQHLRSLPKTVRSGTTTANIWRGRKGSLWDAKEMAMYGHACEKSQGQKTHTRNVLNWTWKAERSYSRVAWALENRAAECKGHVGKGVGAHRVYVNGRKGWKDRENGWRRWLSSDIQLKVSILYNRLA